MTRGNNPRFGESRNESREGVQGSRDMSSLHPLAATRFAVVSSESMGNCALQGRSTKIHLNGRLHDALRIASSPNHAPCRKGAFLSPT